MYVHNMLSKQVLTVHIATFKFYKIIRGSTLTCVPRFQWFQCSNKSFKLRTSKHWWEMEDITKEKQENLAWKNDLSRNCLGGEVELSPSVKYKTVSNKEIEKKYTFFSLEKILTFSLINNSLSTVRSCLPWTSAIHFS